MKNYLTALFLFSCFYAFSQAESCVDYKDGVLKLSDPKLGDFIIKRKGDQQWEINKQLGVKSLFGVTWIDDCTYQLRFIKSKKDETGVAFPENAVITVTFLYMDGNKLVQETSSNLSSQKFQSEMIKIK